MKNQKERQENFEQLEKLMKKNFPNSWRAASNVAKTKIHSDISLGILQVLWILQLIRTVIWFNESNCKIFIYGTVGILFLMYLKTKLIKKLMKESDKASEKDIHSFFNNLDNQNK